jgi:hypothetical protein
MAGETLGARPPAPVDWLSDKVGSSRGEPVSGLRAAIVRAGELVPMDVDRGGACDDIRSARGGGAQTLEAKSMHAAEREWKHRPNPLVSPITIGSGHWPLICAVCLLDNLHRL